MLSTKWQQVPEWDVGQRTFCGLGNAPQGVVQRNTQTPLIGVSAAFAHMQFPWPIVGIALCTDTRD